MQFKKFEPLHEDARIKIIDLIQRGGRIHVEKLEFVDVVRYQNIARIDQWGRVTWRHVGSR